MPPTTSAQVSLTLRVRIDHRPGVLGRVATAIGEAGVARVCGVIAADHERARRCRSRRSARRAASRSSALDVRAREITEAMKMAAAEGIAAIVGDDELRADDHVIPSAFNRDVAPAVADAVAREARRSGWAEADAGELGYAEGDTSEFRAVRKTAP